MDSAAATSVMDDAFAEIEGTILPTLSMLLDSLIDSAALAVPGLDAEARSAELRLLSQRIADLTRQVEATAPLAFAAQPPERARISA